MELLDKQIGEKLKKLREARNLTMREVSDKIGIDYSYISKIENGKIPSLAKLNQLCDLYGVKVASLFGDEVEVPNDLKRISVWIEFAKEMEKQNLSPEDIKNIITCLKTLKEIMNKLGD
ncbi:helix-turn-helix domain-containing protein [Bacillus sp. EB600]|uniref:helix-turn-helix domain-containing protein n=1 Tax=Bacillus sp. EB600 TaxID=2806345 RepID=UPI002109D143|nr:helix-turn-helix transcriptional regulator [Bacillus sp. EB600]MCQ6282128.1 helix-turn-helix transcriptional regulator [Bacillus sp. EB600]